jgi:hypothetical protein
MIVNLEQLMPKKVQFSSFIFFSFVVIGYLSWGYRIGAKEQAGAISFLLSWVSLVAAFAYPLITIYRHKLQLKIASARYQQHLNALSKRELLTLLSHPELRRSSAKMVRETGALRFPHHIDVTE